MSWNYEHKRDIDICLIAPADGGAEIEFTDIRASGVYRVTVYPFVRPDCEIVENLEEQAEASLQMPPVLCVDIGMSRKIELRGLEKGMDYLFFISSSDGRRSAYRLFRAIAAPGKVVCYLHPDDDTYGFSGRYTCSPSLTRLPDGTLLVSHDIYERNGGQCLTRIYASHDNGGTWTHRSDICPCFWGSLFVCKGELYMIGTSTEYGELLIGRSQDWGFTWSDTVKLADTNGRDGGGPHKAPMPVIEYKGRVWTGIDYGSWRIGAHDTCVLSADLSKDLLDAQNWILTPPVRFDESWTGRNPEDGSRPSLLEGNMVVAPDGRLFNMPRFNSKGAIPDYGYTFLMETDTENPAAPVKKYTKIPFEGNLSKFTVHRDFLTGRYYSLVSRVTLPWLSQRNILSLTRSDGLYDGFRAVCDILNYAENGHYEDEKKVGFQYVDWIFDGPDIIAASRTALHGAHNFHDANYITIHKIKDFRNL